MNGWKFFRVMAYLNGAGAFLWLITNQENLTPGFIAGAVAVVAYLVSRNEEDKEKKGKKDKAKKYNYQKKEEKTTKKQKL